MAPSPGAQGGGGGVRLFKFARAPKQNCAHYLPPPPPKYFLTDWAPSPAAGWIRPCLCLYLLLLFPLYTSLSIRLSFISSLSLYLLLFPLNISVLSISSLHLPSLYTISSSLSCSILFIFSRHPLPISIYELLLLPLCVYFQWRIQGGGGERVGPLPWEKTC